MRIPERLREVTLSRHRLIGNPQADKMSVSYDQDALGGLNPPEANLTAGQFRMGSAIPGYR